MRGGAGPLGGGGGGVAPALPPKPACGGGAMPVLCGLGKGDETGAADGVPRLAVAGLTTIGVSFH